jgi:hypothetical protein
MEPPAVPYPAWLPVERLAVALAAAATALVRQPPALQAVGVDGAVDREASEAEAAEAEREWDADMALLEHAVACLGPAGREALCAADGALMALVRTAAERQDGDRLRLRALAALAALAGSGDTAAAALRACGCHEVLIGRRARMTVRREREREIGRERAPAVQEVAVP